MLGNMYPFWAAIAANAIAQTLKPIILYLHLGEWKPALAKDSGGFPSSHTATVTALCFAVGILDKFNSSLFSVTLIFGMITAYDAANVRYYAGQNIKITQQLIKDIQILTQTKLDDPVYLLKVKEVLGHKWIEVIGGVAVGLIVASLMYFMR